MSGGSSDSVILDSLFEEFAERCRHGERPSIDEYAERYPHLAEEIRGLFPTVEVIEELASVGGKSPQESAAAAMAGSAVPQQLGEYRIVREVGRGGMGVVYEAVQESLGRHVALKVLPPHPSISPLHLERFRMEARTAAQLHHTNIVPVFGVGHQDGVHYYAMQFIEGVGLDGVIAQLRRLRSTATAEDTSPRSELTKRAAQALLSGEFSRPARTPGEDTESLRLEDTSRVEPDGRLPGPLPHAERFSPSQSQAALGLSAQGDSQYFRSVAQIGLQVAEALAYAHKRGVLHRDIKPSNLLMDVQGRVWVADFGLVKVEGTDGMTCNGEAVGTLRYMPPERFEGRSEAQSDVYSLGVTFYELLTLRPPFQDANRLRLIDRIKNEKPKWSGKGDRRIPRDLRTIVSKTLEKDPRRRYRTADELTEDLRRFLSDQPIHARRIGYAERAYRWCRRNPGVASLSGLVVILLATIAVVSSVMAARLHTANEELTKTGALTRYMEECTLTMRAPSPRGGAVVPEGPEVILRFGIRASETPGEVYHDVRPILQPLIAHLEQELHRPVVLKIRVFKHYYRLIDAIANGEVDFCRCGPDAYVLATRRNAGIRPLARHGDLDESMIIARRDLDIQTLDELKKLVEDRKKTGENVRLAFGDSISGSGRFRIQEALASVGIYADDVHWEYFGRHDEVAMAVLSGRADVGGLKGAVYEKFFGKKGTHRRAVKIVSYGTEDQVFTGPGKPWAARAGLDNLVVDEKNVSEVLRKCLCEFTLERYKEFWELHAVDVDTEYRKDPPEDWGLPIVQTDENDYSKTGEIQENSRKFFNTLADRLIQSIPELPPEAPPEEIKIRVQQVLDDLEMLDFDILVLQHLRQRKISQTAQQLGIEQSEAREHYLRAQERIEKVAACPPEGPKGP